MQTKPPRPEPASIPLLPCDSADDVGKILSALALNFGSIEFGFAYPVEGPHYIRISSCMGESQFSPDVGMVGALRLYLNSVQRKMARHATA